jgi:hypothetical protein
VVPHRRVTGRLPRLLGWAAVAGVGLVAFLVMPAHADGPGYGGTADRLSVTWQAAVPGGDGLSSGTLPSTGRSQYGADLAVSGVGFRGRSEVEVRVGSGEPFVVRVDGTGTLRAAAPAAQGQVITTGVSVVATGRTPSGTSKTLIGSVPAPASGAGPVDLVPWLVALALVLMAMTWLRPRLARTRVAAAPDAGLALLAEV